MSTARIFDIKRFAVHDGPGIRTTVFFSGCPLRCVWCHNPEGLSGRVELAYYQHKCQGCAECVTACKSGAHSVKDRLHSFEREMCVGCGACTEACPHDTLKLYGREIDVGELLDTLLLDEMFYKNSSGGVTLSGGECLIQADFCAELLCKIKKRGIHTAVDTSGFVSRNAIDKVIPYTDIFLYDLKAYDERVHLACTGVSNKIILENLKYIDSLSKATEIRIPYVPGYNSGEMGAIAEFVRGLCHVERVKLLAYHNYASDKYGALGIVNTLPQGLPTDEEILAASGLFSFKA